MRIAVLSDIHDNIWNLAAAIDQVKTADALLCCGDLCAPFIIPRLAQFQRDIHIVFGNNDADLFRITQNASSRPNVHLHGELFTGEFDGQKFAMNHFDYIGRPLAQSGLYDVVCFGHNHELEVTSYGKTLAINPGPVMGAKVTKSGIVDCPATFVIYDTSSHKAQTFTIDTANGSVSSDQAARRS